MLSVAKRSASGDNWIGLTGPTTACDLCGWAENCDACRARWTWLDGAPMTDDENNLLLDKWKSNEPDDNTGCAYVINNGKWRDDDCDDGQKYICKRGLCNSTVLCVSRVHVLV